MCCRFGSEALKFARIPGRDVHEMELMSQGVGDVGVCLRRVVRVGSFGAYPAGCKGVGFGSKVGAVEGFRRNLVAGVERDAWVGEGEVLDCQGCEAADVRVEAQELGEGAAERRRERACVDFPEAAVEVDEGEGGGVGGGGIGRFLGGEPGVQVG